MKVAVITGTRAEYGLLKPLIKLLDEKPQFELQLIVSGMHLSAEFGNTDQEIISDGFSKFEKVSHTCLILWYGTEFSPLEACSTSRRPVSMRLECNHIHVMLK